MMRELDFDELDRAVSSLLGGTSTPSADDSASATTPTQPAKDAPLGSSDSASPSIVPSPASRRGGRFMDVVHPSSDMKTADGTADAAAPRNSRYSRTVAPSGATPVVATPPPSRRPLAPSPDFRAPEPVAMRTPTPPTPGTTFGATQAPAEEPASDWPDPLDFHGSDHDTEPSTGASESPMATPELTSFPDAASDSLWNMPDPLQSEHASEPADTAVSTSTIVEPAQAEIEAPDEDDDINDIADDIASTLSGGQDEPQTSPFLTDAKVEKRPLGAFSTVEAPESEGIEVVTESTLIDTTPPGPIDIASLTDALQTIIPAGDPAAAHEPAEDQESDHSTPSSGTERFQDEPDLEVPLPEELQDDLLAIESDTTGAELASATLDSVAFDSSLPIQPEEDITGQAAPKVIEAAVTESTDAPSVPKASQGPASIQQQYKETPSTAADVSGSIYDTDSYHEPLKHPAKKKSGWMIVVWIALLLVIGGGGGAAVYFYVLPLL